MHFFLVQFCFLAIARAIEGNCSKKKWRKSFCFQLSTTNKEKFSLVLALVKIFHIPFLICDRPVGSKTCNTNNSIKINLLTRFSLSFCHLRRYKFRHGSKNMLDPFFLAVLKLKTMHNIFSIFISITQSM